jgi:hypothetical protein
MIPTIAQIYGNQYKYDCYKYTILDLTANGIKNQMQNKSGGK